MPYWPIAQVYGAFALPRGPNSFLSLGDSLTKGGFSMATPIVVAPGVYAGAPGGTPIGSGVARKMIVESSRGSGPAGTRGIVDFVPNSQVPRTTIVNRFATPAANVDRTLSGNADTGPRVYALPGATRRRPNVPGAKWWRGGGIERRGYGNATVAPPGRTFAGLPFGLGDVTKWPNSTSADADAWLSANGESQRAKFCGQGWKGSRGKDKDFQLWCAYWASKGASGAGASMYDAPLAALNALYSGLMAGTTAADAPLPAGIEALPDPGSGQPGKTAYDSIQSLLGRMASARQAARYRQYTPPAYNPTSTTPPPSTSNPNASGSVYVNTSGQLVDSSGNIIPGYSGASTTYTGGTGTFVGSDPYGSDPTGSSLVPMPPSTASIVPTAGGDTTLVVNPDGTTSVQPTGDVAGPKGGKKGGGGALLLGALVLGLGAVAYARRRKKAS